MRLDPAITRLRALPAQQIAIAAAITISVTVISFLLPSLFPQRFSSSAILAAGAYASGSRDLIGEASSILASPGQSQPAGLSEARKRITLTQISQNKLRISYNGPDQKQAQPAVQAFTALLCAAHPLETQRPDPTTEYVSLPHPADPKQERQDSLVRLTIAVLDTRIAEYRAGEQQTSAGHAEDDSRITSLVNQKKVLEARLDESRQLAPQAISEPASAAASLFTLIQPATAAKPSPDSFSQFNAFGLLAAALLGLAYLALALWRFRPVSNTAALTQLLSSRSLLIGTIGDFRQ